MKLKFIGDPNQEDFVNDDGSHCFTSGKVYDAEVSDWDIANGRMFDVYDDLGDVWLVGLSDGDFEVAK